MPVDALANNQYYAHECLPNDAWLAFDSVALFDIMLVARARATQVTHMMTDKPSLSCWLGGTWGFVKGNVVVLPQDTVHHQSVIPVGIYFLFRYLGDYIIIFPLQ